MKYRDKFGNVYDIAPAVRDGGYDPYHKPATLAERNRRSRAAYRELRRGEWAHRLRWFRRLWR